MKRFRIFGMGVLLWASINSHAAQTAQATLFCLSVRFHRATSPDGQFTLDLTTLNPSVGLNGELAPTFLDPPEPGYYSRFYEYDTIFDEGFDGYIQFDVPMEADVDDNGFADFFETRQSVSGTTTGDYDASPLDRGTVKSIWSRDAGSKDGTCRIQMKSAMFGQLTDFVHAFFRYLKRKTNYFGSVEFDAPDYNLWLLSIDDVNDADGDGIPDISDDPGSATVRRPTVLLSLGNSNLSFSISSTIGRTLEIQ